MPLVSAAEAAFLQSLPGSMDQFGIVDPQALLTSGIRQNHDQFIIVDEKRPFHL
jgi:hypothetical protein